jgi:hypothetical protein
MVRRFIMVKTTKTRVTVCIPIFPMLRDELEALATVEGERPTSNVERLAGNRKMEGYVFPEPARTPKAWFSEGNRGKMMAGAAGLEPVTSAVTGQRSNQLSYAPAQGTAKIRNLPWQVNRQKGKKAIRAADAKEVGVGNPAEETYRHPNQNRYPFPRAKLRSHNAFVNSVTSFFRLLLFGPGCIIGS